MPNSSLLVSDHTRLMIYRNGSTPRRLTSRAAETAGYVTAKPNPACFLSASNSDERLPEPDQNIDDYAHGRKDEQWHNGVRNKNCQVIVSR